MTRTAHTEMLRGIAPSSVGARLVTVASVNASNQSRGTWEPQLRFHEATKAQPDLCIGTPAYRW